MRKNDEIIIRTVQISDLEKLKDFFIKAYGKNTIFQDEKFLTHYFDAGLNNKLLFSNSLIGINNSGDIVSHYGGLQYNLLMNNKIHSIIWGVSAYTLPEYRGRGCNSKIVDYITTENEINGVIGFTSQTAMFYEKLGYNIFEFNKFTRHVFILDHEKTVSICNHLNQNSNLLVKQKLILDEESINSPHVEVIELSLDNFDDYFLDFDEDFSEITTTYRSREFLAWRFLQNPYIKYSLYGVVKGKILLAYIAMREEVLLPFGYKINRIIDLYGKKDVIKLLLSKALSESLKKRHIYIDFSMFGSIYEMELTFFNFIRLVDEDCCILPQVTSPIENRPNNEFLGIFSILLKDEIRNLSRENVYFTRMDSDRDRIASTLQIN